ncbi:MAG: hypothetical protein SOX18_05765 [Lachnospiraceae bacterium]|nr:hypothetical protein [Lachnospiraceae bacterium]
MRKVIDFLRKFKEDESAVGVVELILILVENCIYKEGVFPVVHYR